MFHCILAEISNFSGLQLCRVLVMKDLFKTSKLLKIDDTVVRTKISNSFMQNAGLDMYFCLYPALPQVRGAGNSYGAFSLPQIQDQ